MNERLQSIFDMVQDLAPADRELLAELLFASLDADAENDEAWLAEIERRAQSEETGESRMIPAEAVFAKHRRP